MRLSLVYGAGGAAVALAAAGCGGSEFSDAAFDAGSARLDAGPSAGDAGDAAASDAGSSWCASQPASTTFCEDFDEYPSSAAGISQLVGSKSWVTFEQNGGTFSFDTSAPPSAPNALDASGDNGADVLLASRTLATLGALTKSLRLEFDFRVDKAGSIGALSAVGVATIAFGTSLEDGYAAIAIGQGPTLAAFWQLPSTAADAGLANSFKSQAASGSFPTVGQWAGRYAVEIDYSGAGAQRTGCVQIYEGVTPLLAPCLALPPALVNPGEVTVAIGDYAAGADQTGNVELEFDNVTFAAK